MSEQNSNLPRIAGYKPQYMELETGKSYLWCSCGLSKDQPFCDQSHKGTAFKPVRYVAREPGEEVLFCTCKQSADGPFCDGAHNNLKDVYDEDDPDSEQNLGIQLVAAGADGRAILDGGCYVANVDRIPLQSHGTLQIGTIISADTGALYQSQFYAEVRQGRSPIVSFGDSHVVVLVTRGSGVASISGREFAVGPESGFYVRPGEAFSLDNPHSVPFKLYISVCPLAEGPELLDEMPDNFNGE